MTVWWIVMLFLAQVADSEAAARQAVDDFRAGKYEQARQGFRAALTSAPQNAALWAYLGLTEGGLNDVPAAISALEKARALAPADPQILFNLGLFYGKAGNQEKSREAYRQGLQAEPGDPGANQNYALLLMQAGLFDLAIVPLERLRKLAPTNPSVGVSLIECRFKAGRKNEVEEEIRSFQSRPGATLEDSLKTAAVLAGDGASGAAELVLADATLRYDDSAEVQAGLGKLLLDRGQYEDAVLHLGKAAQLQPDKPGYAIGLAEALLRWKHYTPALQFLEAVRPKFGTLPDFRYELGLVLYAMSRYPQALAEFEALVKERPRADSAWFSLGNTWLAMGTLEAAEKAYRTAITLNPRDSRYYAALGVLLRSSEADRLTEAAEVLHKALALDPSDYMSMKELALCEERQGRLEQASALLQQVVLRQPDFKAAHVGLARISYKLHRNADGDREKQIVTQLEAEERAHQQARSAGPSDK